jgi:hypothetical protein
VKVDLTVNPFRFKNALLLQHSSGLLLIYLPFANCYFERLKQSWNVTTFAPLINQIRRKLKADNVKLDLTVDPFCFENTLVAQHGSGL